MIEKSDILNELGGAMALWCAADLDGGELARCAEFVVQEKVSHISVSPDSIPVVWPWLEGVDVKIYGRFYLDANRIGPDEISDVTVKINAALRSGASGAQVFLRYANLHELVAQTHVIRDDLFFDKDLIIGLDINDIGADDWGDLFQNLKKIKASAVLFFLGNDAGDKSDFVGRLYGLLNAWDDGFGGALHFALGDNYLRIEQVMRMAERMKPELAKRLKFFVS